MASKPSDLAGTERAAILLMSLGEQDAANLLKQLDAREVQRLGVAMAELKEVSREQMTSVLDTFIGVVDGKVQVSWLSRPAPPVRTEASSEIGRASCRERVC